MSPASLNMFMMTSLLYSLMILFPHMSHQEMLAWCMLKTDAMLCHPIPGNMLLTGSPHFLLRYSGSGSLAAPVSPIGLIRLGCPSLPAVSPNRQSLILPVSR